MRRTLSSLAGIALGLALLTSLSRAAAAPFVVVVNPCTHASRLRRHDIERIYRRAMRFWPDGSRIYPVNLPFESPLRQAFHRIVLRATADSLATFWNRQYFQGVLPPPVLRSPEAIQAYVAATCGAIGYLPPALADESLVVVWRSPDE